MTMTTTTTAGVSRTGWGDYNTYTQRVAWHRLCQGKEWDRAIFYMLLACAAGLRSFTQMGARSFLPISMARSPLPNFAVVSLSGFGCTFLPLPPAGERKDKTLGIRVAPQAAALTVLWADPQFLSQ